jgi:hypothetical protein
MALIEIKCPRCGSACAKTRKTEEYLCGHCGAVFKFCDASKRVVTSGSLIRNCQFCGKPIDGTKGFKCTECEREFFCESCVDQVDSKYVCVQCIETLGKACPFCGRYAEYACVECGEKACVEHPAESNFIKSDEIKKGTVLYCDTCQSYVCWHCAKKSLLGALKCPKCLMPLEGYYPIGYSEDEICNSL